MSARSVGDPLDPMLTYEQLYGSDNEFDPGDGPPAAGTQSQSGGHERPQPRRETARGTSGSRRPATELRGTPVLVRMSDVRPEHVDWQWPGRLPQGKLAVLDGDPGLGKSTVTIDIAARVSTGSPFADGSEPGAPGAVILLNAEDGLGDTIRPRLEAAGADLSRVLVLDGIETDESPIRRPWSLPGDIELLRQVVQQNGAVLVVIDPLMAFLHRSVDGFRDQDVRAALHPLARVAEETAAVVLVVRHLNKSAGVNAIYRGGGSIGIIGAARAGLVIGADPDDASGRRRVLAVSKLNVGVPAPALAYHLESDDDLGCGRVVWEGVTDHDANALLSGPCSPERSQTEAVAEMLRGLTADGPIAVEDARAALRDAGYEPPEATLRRARERAGLKTGRPAGFGGQRSYERAGAGGTSPISAGRGRRERTEPTCPSGDGEASPVNRRRVSGLGADSEPPPLGDQDAPPLDEEPDRPAGRPRNAEQPEPARRREAI